MGSKGFEWVRIGSNGFKWAKIGWNGFKWVGMRSNGFKLVPKGSNGFGWVRMGYNGFELVLMGSNWLEKKQLRSARNSDGYLLTSRYTGIFLCMSFSVLHWIYSHCSFYTSEVYGVPCYMLPLSHLLFSSIDQNFFVGLFGPP